MVLDGIVSLYKFQCNIYIYIYLNVCVCEFACVCFFSSILYNVLCLLAWFLVCVVQIRNHS